MIKKAMVWLLKYSCHLHMPEIIPFGLCYEWLIFFERTFTLIFHFIRRVKQNKIDCFPWKDSFTLLDKVIFDVAFR